MDWTSNWNFHFFPHSVLWTTLLTHANEGIKHMIHSAVRVLGALSRKYGDWGWDFNHLKMVFLFFTNTEYCVLSWIIDYNPWFCKESFVFTSLTFKIVQHFWNGPVYEFYGLKATVVNWWTKFVLVLTNTDMLNLREQNFKGEANNKQLDSEDSQRSNFSSYLVSKLISCVKYPDSFIWFRCVQCC